MTQATNDITISGVYPYTLFKKPDGRQVEQGIGGLDDEDVNWLKSKKIKISAERGMGTMMIFYFDFGRTEGDDPSEDPDEYIHLMPATQTANQMIREVRPILTKLIAEMKVRMEVTG